MPPPSKQKKPELAARLYAFIHHVHGSCNRDLVEELHRGDLTLAQVRLLEHLRRSRRDPTITAAAKHLGLHPAAAGRVIEELDGRGLVDRYEDESDHRRRRVTITSRGRQVLLELSQVRLDAIRAYTHGLTPAEHRKLSDALDELGERDEMKALTPTK